MEVLRFRRESHLFAVLRNGRPMRIPNDVDVDWVVLELKHGSWEGHVELDTFHYVPRSVMRMLDE